IRDAVPLTGEANAQAASLAQAPVSTPYTGPIVTDGGSLTVELFFTTPLSPADLDAQITLVAQWAGGDNRTFRLNLSDAADGPDGVDGNDDDDQRYRLTFVKRQRSNHVFAVNTDLNGAHADDYTFAPDTVYYVAVVFDNAADENTFYLQDLTNGGPLVRKTVAQGFGNWEGGSPGFTTAPVTIGGMRAGEAAFTGVIDEVRISDSALDATELLISAEPG
ncbi:MAG: LamG-like jellyroll fold domain-containing protein, partial [Actinomycetota bacterium]